MDLASMKRRELQALCKRHGLAGGGSNADLVARLAAILSGYGGAEEQVVGAVVGKGCLKRSGGGASGGSSGAAKKVTFVLEEEAEVAVRGRRRRPQVMWSSVVANTRGTRGRRKAGQTLPGAEVGGDTADEGVAGQAGADAPVRRSRRNAINLRIGDGVERVAGVVSPNNSGKAEEEEEEVGEAVDRKRKWKTMEYAEDVAIGAQVGVSRGSLRSSGVLLEVAVVSSPLVEKKRGRRKAGDVKEQQMHVEEQPAEIQCLGRTLRSGSLAVVTAPLVVESKRNRRKVQEEEPVVEKSAKVEIFGRTTRSSSATAAVVSPIVVENKRKRKMEDVHSDGELPTVSKVPINDAPVTRALRNRSVQVNNNVVEENHIGKKLENKRQSSRPATRRYQQLAYSVEEEAQEQVAAPCMGHPPRRSRRNNSESVKLLLNNNTSSESNNQSRAPMEVNDFKIARPLTRNAAKNIVKDDVAKAHGHLEFTKRNLRNDRAKVARNTCEVSFSGISGKASVRKMQLEVIKPVKLRRKSVVPSLLEKGTKAMHGIVRCQEFQNVKGEDAEKQPVVKVPVRRSTQKSAAPALLEKEMKGLTVEMNPEPLVRRSMWKSDLPIPSNENKDHGQMVRIEDFQSSRDEDLEKQPAVKEPVRRSTQKPVIPAMLEKERMGIPAEMNPDAHVRRSTRKSLVPNILNNESKDHGAMVRSEDLECAKDGDVEKQLEAKEPVRRSTHKSLAPVVFEKENKGLHEERKSEVPVRRSLHKSIAPNAVDKENKNQSEMVRSEEPRVRTRSSQTRFAAPAMQVGTSGNKLQVEVVVQNDVGPQPQSKTIASIGKPAKRRTSPPLQEVMSVEEPKAEDMVIREAKQDGDKVTHEYNEEASSSIQKISQVHATGEEFASALLLGTLPEETQTCRVQSVTEEILESEFGDVEPNTKDMVVREAKQDGDKVTHEYNEEPSSSIQKISQDNATGEKLASVPFLGTLPEETETCRVQSVNEEILESESGDVDKGGQSLCATEITHQCEQAQEYGELQTDNDHSSEVRCVELDQSSNIAELGLHAGIVSESKALLDEGESELGVKGIQTLSADSYKDGLGALNKSAGIAQEIRSTTAVFILEAEAPVDEGFNNNGVDVGMQDVNVALPEQLLGASDKLQIVDEVPPYDRGAVVLEKETDMKSTEDTQNVNIVFTNDGFVASKSKAIAEEVSSCTETRVLEDDTLADEDFEGIGMKSKEASLPLLDTGSHKNESDGQSIKSLEVLSFESDPNYLPIVNAETEKQSGEAKHHQPSCDKTNTSDFSSFSGSLEIDVQIDFTVGDHGEEYPASPMDEQRRVSVEANANESAEKTLADNIMPAGLHNKDPQHEHDHVPGKMVDILAQDYGKAFGSDANSHQFICPTIQDESGNRPEVHSDTVAEESIQDAHLWKCLSNDKEGNPLSTTLHAEGAVEDKSMFPIPSDVEGSSSDGRHSSFGLNFLFVEQDKESYPMNDENIAAKIDFGNKSIDCRTPCFYPGSDCSLEDEDLQLTGDDADSKLDMEQYVAKEEGVTKDKSMLLPPSDVSMCSSDGRHSLFGRNAVSAEKGTGGYVTNDAHAAAEINCKRTLDDETASFYLESDCSLEEKDMGLVVDNRGNKLAMEQVQQDDVQEGTLEKTSLGSATPECEHECGLREEAELHSMKNERCSSSAEQSSFCLQSLFSQESIEELKEYRVLAAARVHAENGIGEPKDCHVKYRVEKSPVSGGPASDHDAHIDFSLVSKNGDCMYTFQQENESEGLAKSSHEEHVASGQLGSLEAANFTKGETTSEGVAYEYEDEENNKPMHSTDINSSCEKSDANRPAEHCISDALLSSSLNAPANDNDKVHLSFNLSHLESNNFMEPTGCSITEVPHKGLKEQYEKHKEDQIAYGACTSNLIEASTSKDLECCGVLPPLAEETSNLRDELLNSKLEGTEVAESDICCDKDTNNILEPESVVNNVGKRTPSVSSLLKDSSMDHCQQQELLDVFEESAMCSENSDPRAGATNPDRQHVGAMSKDAVHSMKNDAGRCLLNLKHSPIGLQFVFSQENMELSDTHDAIVFPNSENRVDESNVCHVECRVEKNVSLEPDSYQGSCKDLSRVEENGSCMFWCQSIVRSCTVEISTKLHCDHQEESNQHNEDEVTPAVLSSGMSEPGPVEGSESGTTLLPSAETSILPTEQLSTNLEGNEEHISCGKDTINICDTGSMENNNLSSLPKYSHIDPCHAQELSDDMSAPKSPKESAMSG